MEKMAPVRIEVMTATFPKRIFPPFNWNTQLHTPKPYWYLCGEDFSRFRVHMTKDDTALAKNMGVRSTLLAFGCWRCLLMGLG